MSGLWRGWISLEGGNGLYTGSFSLWNGDSGLIDDPVEGAAPVLTAPTLTLTSDVGRRPVTWNSSADDTIFAGYVYRLQVATNSDRTGIVQDISHDIVGGELNGASSSYDLSGDGYSEPPVGTHYYFARYERDDGENSPWSNVMTVVVYDFVPTAFSFTDQTDLEPSTLVYSNSITVLGVSAGATCEWSLTGSGFEAQVNGTGAWATSGTCELNDTIQQRGTTSAADDTPLSGVLDIEGVTDTWTIRTAASAAAVVATHRSTQIRDYGYGSTPGTAWDSFAIADGDKVVLHVHASENVGSLSAITANSGAITFTQVGSPVSDGNDRVSLWYADTSGATSIAIAFTAGSSVKGIGFTAFSVTGAASGAPTASAKSYAYVGGDDAHDIDGGLAAATDGVLLLTACTPYNSAPPFVWTGATEVAEVDSAPAAMSSAIQTTAAAVSIAGPNVGGLGYTALGRIASQWDPA